MLKIQKKSILHVIMYSALTCLGSNANSQDTPLNLSVKENSANITEKTSSFTLEQAINFALDHNPDLEIAQQRIKQAEAQLGLALSSFYPQITARYSYQYTENPAMVFSHTINQRRLDFNSDFNNPGGVENLRPEVIANISLFRGGQDYQLSKAAQLGTEAATLEKSAVRNNLTQAVISAYYGYLAAQEAYKVTQSSIKAVSSELEQSRKRYKAGTLLKSDLLSLEVQLAQAKEATIRAKNNIELAKTGLKTLLGLDMNEAFAITKQSEWSLPQAPPAFSDILKTALAQRPEIQAINKQIASQERVLKAAYGAHLPRVNAYVSYGQDSKDGSFSSRKDYVTAGVNLEMDIFSGFATNERINKAQSKLAEIKASKKRLQLNIENEVKTAYLRLQEALARVNVTITAIASAEEAYRMVKQQREAGTVTVTRYIESEVARDSANSRAIAAQFDALRTEAELNKAQGNWK